MEGEWTAEQRKPGVCTGRQMIATTCDFTARTGIACVGPDSFCTQTARGGSGIQSQRLAGRRKQVEVIWEREMMFSSGIRVNAGRCFGVIVVNVTRILQ